MVGIIRSFKFLLVKLWFIVPILFYGIHFFQKEKMMAGIPKLPAKNL